MSKKSPAKPPTVESILKECEAKMKQGLGKKRLSADARAFWTATYTKSIKEQLNAGGNWNHDRKRVLPVAKKLGKVANALSTGNIVLKWAAEAAAVAVKSDPGCPSLGAGGWCEFLPI
jgi:hypothetical protein